MGEEYIDTPCPCTRAGYCPHFGRTLVGRNWEVGRLDNELGRKWRRIWAERGPEEKPDCGCKGGQLRKTP